MARDTWLPVGYDLPNGAKAGLPLYEGEHWQILEAPGGDRVLLAEPALHDRWVASGLLASLMMAEFQFGERRLYSLVSRSSQALVPISEAPSVWSISEALSFAISVKATRQVDAESALHDALFVEKLSRLLPTFTLSEKVADEVVLGYWLTGGANISVKAFRRLQQMLSWMPAPQLKEVIRAAGFDSPEGAQAEAVVVLPTEGDTPSQTESRFTLPGRPELEAFFSEHVIDIVRNQRRYQAFGIESPSAVILHGPPGCGKTFAVQKLVDYLEWPSYEIDASSVASPYIHETSKKIAEVFEKAIENAPSVIVLDEMESFLADRQSGAGHHRVEEVAEFLRRIPEAIKHGVLIIAMTNRLEMIDPAILRRGRFDHLIEVAPATAEEIIHLLQSLLLRLPCDDTVNAEELAAQLAGRPLSDVSFVVREGARLAARNDKDCLDQATLLAALASSSARSKEPVSRRIGFV